MSKTLALTGNEASAYAMKQINPDVVAAYPITPQTSLMQKFADFVSDGLVDTEMILVESEHSAMSACVGSAAAGARTMTATSSNGLALMWEIVYITAGLRLPIVMPVVNRTLSAPLNIHCDHSDAMGARDSGWIQIYAENAQECYDNVIQAIRIAEHKDVLLPVMPCSDGFIISHAIESVTVSEDEKVKDFIGEYKAEQTLLDIKNPKTYGSIELQDFYFEHKRQQSEAMRNSLEVVRQISKEFSKEFGRNYDLIEGYQLEDADVAITALGSTAGTLKQVVDSLRSRGVKAGLLKIRCFRPFPVEDIISALKNVKALAVLDRADSCDGVGGPLFGDVRSALYRKLNLPVTNYIYGLGGRDIKIKELECVYNDLAEIVKTGNIKSEVNYLSLRSDSSDVKCACAK